MPSRRHSSAMLCSPRRPSSTIRIFSAAEYCLRVARRMSFTIRSDDGFKIARATAAAEEVEKPELLRLAIPALVYGTYPGASTEQRHQLLPRQIRGVVHPNSAIRRRRRGNPEISRDPNRTLLRYSQAAIKSDQCQLALIQHRAFEDDLSHRLFFDAYGFRSLRHGMAWNDGEPTVSPNARAISCLQTSTCRQGSLSI